MELSKRSHNRIFAEDSQSGSITVCPPAPATHSSSSANVPVKRASVTRTFPLTSSVGCGMISATFQFGPVPFGCNRLIMTAEFDCRRRPVWQASSIPPQAKPGSWLASASILYFVPSLPRRSPSTDGLTVRPWPREPTYARSVFPATRDCASSTPCVSARMVRRLIASRFNKISKI